VVVEALGVLLLGVLLWGRHGLDLDVGVARAKDVGGHCGRVVAVDVKAEDLIKSFQMWTVSRSCSKLQML